MLNLLGTVNEVTKKFNYIYELDYGLRTNMFLNRVAVPTKERIISKLLAIKVMENSRLHSVAGKAFYQHSKHAMHIQLHSALLDSKDEISINFKNTLFHEIAHLLAYLIDHTSEHNFTWSYCMMQFGEYPERTYNGFIHNFRGYKERKETREEDNMFNGLNFPDMRS